MYHYDSLLLILTVQRRQVVSIRFYFWGRGVGVGVGSGFLFFCFFFAVFKICGVERIGAQMISMISMWIAWGQHRGTMLKMLKRDAAARVAPPPSPPPPRAHPPPPLWTKEASPSEDIVIEESWRLGERRRRAQENWLFFSFFFPFFFLPNEQAEMRSRHVANFTQFTTNLVIAVSSSLPLCFFYLVSLVYFRIVSVRVSFTCRFRLALFACACGFRIQLWPRNGAQFRPSFVVHGGGHWGPELDLTSNEKSTEFVGGSVIISTRLIVIDKQLKRRRNVNCWFAE